MFVFDPFITPPLPPPGHDRLLLLPKYVEGPLLPLSYPPCKSYAKEEKVIGYAAVLKNVRYKTSNHEIFRQEQE